MKEDVPSHAVGIALPYVSLQPDYSQIHTDVSQGLHSVDKAWLSVYCLNAPAASIHTKILLTAGEGSSVHAELDKPSAGSLALGKSAGDQNIDLSVSTNASQWRPSNIRERKAFISVPQTRLRVPRRTVGPLVRTSLGVTAFDSSPTDNCRYVVGGSDGQAHIGRLYDSGALNDRNEESSQDSLEALAQSRMQKYASAHQSQSRVYLKGHKGDIRSSKFFPSGEVVLTTSSDCTARIYGLDGSNPRTFTGHRRGILSADFVDRGQKILTGSSDGTTRLWDVGQNTQLANLVSEQFSAVNTISLGRSSNPDGKGKLLMTGLSNGTIEAFDLTSNQVAFRIGRSLFPPGPEPAGSDYWEQVMTGGIAALDWDDERKSLLAGCTNGIMALHDVRMVSSNSSQESTSIRGSWRRNGARINDVKLLPGQEALVATADGTPYKASIDLDSHIFAPRVLEEYTGWDVDNVQVCGLDTRQHVWMAGADGYVRMYY